MEKKYPTIIHERIEKAKLGSNQTLICRLTSGWVVLGDDQRLKGYCVLLHDPIVEDVNTLSTEDRARFFMDVTIVGDALLEELNATIINYSILGNKDRALHCHIHPRYKDEPEETRNQPPFIYHYLKIKENPFDYERDRILIDGIKNAIAKKVALYEGKRL